MPLPTDHGLPGSNPVSVITQIQLLMKQNKSIHPKHWLKNGTNLLKNESDKREWYQRDSENLKCRKKSAKVSKLRTAECGGQFFAHKIFAIFFGRLWRMIFPLYAIVIILVLILIQS